MAEKFLYKFENPDRTPRLIYSSIATKSAPPGTNAEPKWSATFGIQKEDFDAIVKLEVQAITSETGSFTKPEDYYLACTSGETSARRALAKAELDARGKSPDDAFKIKEKAEKRAELYRQFAGILTTNSKFGIGIARLENGRVISLAEDHEKDIAQDARDKYGKDFFYPGAFVAPVVQFQGYRRKNLEAKDGVTCFLQNALFVRNGERLGGSGPANSDVFGGYAGYSPVDPTALAPGGAGQPDAELAGGF